MTTPSPIETCGPVERAGLLGAWLVSGETVTCAQVAQAFGMSWAGAWRMLDKLSAVLPIVRNGADWRMLRPSR